MVGAPERIWAFQSDGGQRGWLHTQPPQAIIDIPIAYVRADLFDALTEERDRLKQWQADQVEVNEEAKALITELNADKKALEAGLDRLALANAELLAGLEPFAKVADQLHPGKYGPAWGFNKAIIEHEDFQKARALLDKYKATSTEREVE